MDLITRLCDPVFAMAKGRLLTHCSFSQVANDAVVQEAYFGRRHFA